MRFCCGFNPAGPGQLQDADAGTAGRTGGASGTNISSARQLIHFKNVFGVVRVSRAALFPRTVQLSSGPGTAAPAGDALSVASCQRAAAADALQLRPHRRHGIKKHNSEAASRLEVVGGRPGGSSCGCLREPEPL